MRYSQKKLHPSKFSKLRRFTPYISAVLLLVIVVTTLELTNTTHLLHKKRAVSSTIPATVKTESNDGNDTASTPSTPDTSATPTTPTTPTNTKVVGAPSTSAPLIAPSGNFVSNHKPSLSHANDVPSQLQSVCNTTPGATCTITFTNTAGIVKTLAAKTTDATGSVIWDWDVNAAGFTTGTWKITATATLNGDSKSNSDPQSLEVQS